MRSFLPLAFFGLFVVLLGGCRFPARQEPAPAPPEVAKPEPTYQDNELSLPLVFKGKPFADLRQHTFSEVGEDNDPAVSHDGKLLAFSSTSHSGEPDIYIKAVAGRAVTRKTFDPSSEIQPAFSPDDNYIAFASNLNGNWDIFIIRTTDDTARRQVTTEESEDLHPSFSPDGKKLVFCSYSYQLGQWELWIADLETGGMTDLGYGGLFPEWSPKGDLIAFQRARDRDEHWFDIWTVRPDGSSLSQVAGSGKWGAIGPAWSPDGQRIYLATVPPDSQQEAGGLGMGRDIWAADLRTGAYIQITFDDLVPDWSPTCSSEGRVYFCSKRNGYVNIWSLLPLM